MWTIRHQTPENIEVVLAMHTAQFNKRNVLCEMTATCVTVGMVSTLSIAAFFWHTHRVNAERCARRKRQPEHGYSAGSVGKRDSERREHMDFGRWQTCVGHQEAGRRGMEGARPAPRFTRQLSYSWQILIRSGINDDDSLIDPLSRVVIGVAAEQRNDHALALKCYECSAEEGSWHAMRKLAALFVAHLPSPHIADLI